MSSDVGQLDFYTTPDWVAAIISDRVERGPDSGRPGMVSA